MSTTAERVRLAATAAGTDWQRWGTRHLCLGLALWNGRDPILKEQLFGLSNREGNHGEDVKEYYFYLDNTPTHSYARMLYKYPHTEFPYADLVAQNSLRGSHEPEYELFDAAGDAFRARHYFDVFVEYAKAGPQDVLCRIRVVNHGPGSPFVKDGINDAVVHGRADRVNAFAYAAVVVRRSHEKV
jgi:hypothetical protein